MLGRARHRSAQFVGALRPRVGPRDRDEAHALLDAPQRAIFDAMMPRDRQHGIDVCRRVRFASGADRALLVAALLHDCGKGRVALWQRVTYVLLAASARDVLSRIAHEDAAEWRRAFWRLLHHPALGAAMVERAGGDPETVRMIREQESATPDARLALLQAADEA